MISPRKNNGNPILMTGDEARRAIEKKIRHLQRRISVTENPKIKKWAEKALSLGRYKDCYWILRIEGRTDPKEYLKWLDWLKRLEKTLI